ncbi:MAG: hypothetical protein R3E79_00040 [Caldilineaceae bacterium]
MTRPFQLLLLLLRTDALIVPEELVVVDFNTVGTAVLQDQLFAKAAWLVQAEHEAIAKRRP